MLHISRAIFILHSHGRQSLNLTLSRNRRENIFLYFTRFSKLRLKTNLFYRYTYLILSTFHRRRCCIFPLWTYAKCERSLVDIPCYDDIGLILLVDYWLIFDNFTNSFCLRCKFLFYTTSWNVDLFCESILKIFLTINLLWQHLLFFVLIYKKKEISKTNKHVSFYKS